MAKQIAVFTSHALFDERDDDLFLFKNGEMIVLSESSSPATPWPERRDMLRLRQSEVLQGANVVVRNYNKARHRITTN